MTRSLPGFSSGLLSASGAAVILGTSIPRGSIFGGSTLGASALGGVSWSGAIEGASMPAAASTACGAAASAAPVFWPASSGIASLTAQILQSGLTFW